MSATFSYLRTCVVHGLRVYVCVCVCVCECVCVCVCVCGLAPFAYAYNVSRYTGAQAINIGSKANEAGFPHIRGTACLGPKQLGRGQMMRALNNGGMLCGCAAHCLSQRLRR